jgi:hypothetical protein
MEVGVGEGRVRVEWEEFIFNRSIVQGLENHDPLSKSSPIPVLGNEILFEKNHIYLLRYCLWLYSGYNGRVEYL